MNITFSSGDFLRFGIIIYVAIWLLMIWRRHRRYGRHERFDVVEYEKMTERIKLFRQSGWLLAPVIAVIGVCVTPQLLIVTGSEWKDEKFEVRRVYVPFYYDGHVCPLTRHQYLHNRSDFDLGLYWVSFYDGKFKEAASADEIAKIEPGKFTYIDRYLTSWFSPPYEPISVSDSERFSNKTKWYLDSISAAVYNIQSVRFAIKRRYDPFLRFSNEPLRLDSFYMRRKMKENLMKEMYHEAKKTDN